MIRPPHLIFLLSLTFSLATGWSQDSQQVYINSGVNLQEDPTLDSVISVWKQYLTSDDNGIGSSPYWNKKAVNQYMNYDFNAVRYGRNWYWNLGYQPSIISVIPQNEYYQIKTMWSRAVDSPQVDLLAIMNVYAKKVNGGFQLFNPLFIHTQDWEKRTIGSIQYHFPPAQTFNDSLAREMFESKFADKWRTIQKAKGFDYYSGMGAPSDKVRARQNGANDMVFTNAGRPWHAHEIVHIYLVPEFPEAGYFHEGVACLFGGHMYHSLDWHYPRLHNYLQDHPDLNLDSLFQFTYTDEYTNPRHALSGLFCQIAYERGGIDKLTTLLRYGETRSNEYSYKENYYAALEEVLGIRRDNLNEFIRKELRERSQEAE